MPTKQINSNLEKIYANLKLENYDFSILFFRQEQKEFILLVNYVSVACISYYIIEIKKSEYVIKTIINDFSYDKLNYRIDCMMIEKCRNITKIYNGDNTYICKIDVNRKIFEMNENTLYSVNYDKIYLYHINDDMEINEETIIDVANYGTIHAWESSQDKIFMIMRKKGEKFALSYNIKNNKFEFENSINNLKSIIKIGKMIVFHNHLNIKNVIKDITANTHNYDIISPKINVLNINAHDIYFKFI